MESLRARAEEVSSGASGDAHAKLLRQVETLQTQYAIASENWQGIEGSMLSRIAGLERERDDLAKKEGDIRRKARELVSPFRRFWFWFYQYGLHCGRIRVPSRRTWTWI